MKYLLIALTLFCAEYEAPKPVERSVLCWLHQLGYGTWQFKCDETRPLE